MRRSRLRFWSILTLVSATIATSRPAAACFCKNIAAVLTEVVYEPDAETATRVRMHGAFAFLLDQATLGSWTEPEPGYLYLECPAGSDAACRLEWGEIEAWSATHDCPAFGDHEARAPRVRPDGEPPADPDTYGLLQFGGVDDPLGLECQELEDALEADVEPPPDPGVTPDPTQPAPDDDAAPQAQAAACSATRPTPLPPRAAMLAALIAVLAARRSGRDRRSMRRSDPGPRAISSANPR